MLNRIGQKFSTERSYNKAILPMVTFSMLLVIAAGNVTAQMDKSDTEYTDKAKNAWLDGRLESAYALNRHLNPFTIDTKISGNVAHLSGTVDSDIEKDLAEQIALSFNEITKVENNIQVNSASQDKMEGTRNSNNTFSQAIEDATVTASVKTKLLANNNVKGLKINVDTKDNVVTLSGKVGSDAEKDLVEQLAENTDNVGNVLNRLVIEK